MPEVKVTIDKVEGNELVIRTGEALKLDPPRKIKFISENVHAPYKFHADYDNLKSPETFLVLASMKAESITFFEDPTDHACAEITGQLTRDTQLDFLGVNSKKQMALNDLRKILKQCKPYFISETDCDKIISLISNFDFKKTVTGSDKDDRRGNVNRSLQVTTTTDVPFSFTLVYPLFLYERPEPVKVDIYFTVTENGSVFFEFESFELITAFREKAKQIIEREISLFEDQGIAVITL